LPAFRVRLTGAVLDDPASALSVPSFDLRASIWWGMLSFSSGSISEESVILSTVVWCSSEEMCFAGARRARRHGLYVLVIEAADAAAGHGEEQKGMAATLRRHDTKGRRLHLPPADFDHESKRRASAS
jgi:hypothetical protein